MPRHVTWPFGLFVAAFHRAPCAHAPSFSLALLGGVQLEQFTVAVSCCNDALALDDKSLKALYNRARARLLAPTSGGLEIDMAVADLQAGLVICSDDVAADGSVPASAFSSQLAKVQRDRKRQSAADKRSFGGMFDRKDRAPLYDDGGDGDGDGAVGDKAVGSDNSGSDDAAQAGAGSATAGGDGGGGGGSGGKKKKGSGVVDAAAAHAHDVESQWDRLAVLVKDLRAQGRDADADELQRALDSALAAGDPKGRKAGTSDPRTVDFTKPTPEMRAEAEKMG